MCECVCVDVATHGTKIWHNEKCPVSTLLVSCSDASWASVRNHMVSGVCVFKGLKCNVIVSVKFVFAVV